jgi:hypothetical protein
MKNWEKKSRKMAASGEETMGNWLKIGEEPIKRCPQVEEEPEGRWPQVEEEPEGRWPQVEDDQKESASVSGDELIGK